MISWESSLEDLMEDEDLVEDLEEAEENQNVETGLTNEDINKTFEEDKAFISHEEKRVCIKNLILLSLAYSEARVNNF